MSALTRLMKFGLGGMVGAAIGGAATYFSLPKVEMSSRVRSDARVAEAKLAGAEAQAQTEQALINRFRARVHDHAALTATEMSARSAVTKAAQDVAVAGTSS